MKKQENLTQKEKILAKLKRKLDRLEAKETRSRTHVGSSFYGRALIWMLVCAGLGAGIGALASVLTGAAIFATTILSSFISLVVGLFTGGLVSNLASIIAENHRSRKISELKDKIEYLEMLDETEIKQEARTLKTAELKVFEQQEEVKTKKREIKQKKRLLKKLIEENANVVTSENTSNSDGLTIEQ